MKLKLIVLISCWMLFIGCKQGEKEVVIVPKNYKGYIVIIYNQMHGARQVYYKGSRLYIIPYNGILKTEFSGNYGYIGLPEFYYESIEPNNIIPFSANHKNNRPDAVIASGGSTGKAYKKNDQYVEFQIFYIGNQKEIAKAFEAAEKLDISKL